MTSVIGTSAVQCVERQSDMLCVEWDIISSTQSVIHLFDFVIGNDCMN